MTIKRLLRLIDGRILIAGVIPVILASVYSLYRYDQVNWFDMVILSIAMVLIQSSANLINGYFWAKRGREQEETTDERPLVLGESTKASHVLKLIGVFMGIDVIIALYFAIKIHYGLLLVGLIGVLVMYLYSGGRKPISHTSFGEFIAGSTMGFGIMTSVIYIQSGIFNIETTLVALPMAIYIGTILLTNNIADHAEDIKIGRRTLAIRLGIRWSQVLWFACCHSLLTFTLAFVFVGFYPVTTLVLALIMFPYRSTYEFRRLPKNVAHKGQMMRIIGHIGIRYHMAILIGLLMTIIFHTVVV